MDKIAICEKIVPYSHVPGTRCLVPYSDWVIEVFPALLRIEGKRDVPIGITGPIEQFLVQLDLERDCIWMSGKAREGFYRLQIKATQEGLFITVRRAPKEGLSIDGYLLVVKDTLLLASGGRFTLGSICERLSLGSWKAQDMELIRRRSDVREVVPVLFLLGQKVPQATSPEGAGEGISPKMDVFFRSTFSGLFVPHLQDIFHQGIQTNNAGQDPLALLNRAYRTIRSDLLEEGNTKIAILPGIKEYPVGRAKLRTSFGWIHLEWTQGILRRMMVELKESCQLTFVFPKEVASFRYAGTNVLNGDVVSLPANRFVLFDRFQRV